MSGRSMWAKTPTGSETAVDHLKLLVQIRSNRVAAPTNKIEDAKEAHHGPGHLRKKNIPNEWKCHVEKNSDWFKKAG